MDCMHLSKHFPKFEIQRLKTFFVSPFEKFFKSKLHNNRNRRNQILRVSQNFEIRLKMSFSNHLQIKFKKILVFKNVPRSPEHKNDLESNQSEEGNHRSTNILNRSNQRERSIATLLQKFYSLFKILTDPSESTDSHFRSSILQPSRRIAFLQ